MEHEPLRLAATPTTDLSIDIAAPLERVWELVTDIDLPGRFSDEYQGGEWLDGPARLGATFRGRNRRRDVEWETVSTVVTYEPMRAFGWAVSDVTNPAATWTLLLEPTETGTALTYRMQLGPGPSGLTGAIERKPDREHDIIQRRIEEQRMQMQAVLEGIKSLAES